jgi:hypothetical protein
MSTLHNPISLIFVAVDNASEIRHISEWLGMRDQAKAYNLHRLLRVSALGGASP